MSQLAVMGDLRDFPEPEVAYIPMGALVIDPNYQRDLSSSWVKELIAKWDDNAVGFIGVSARPGGIYAILAGQHRTEAMRRMGFRGAWCRIYRGLSAVQEAALYGKGNAQRLPHVLNRFKAAVAAKEEPAVSIERIARDAGFHIAYDHNQADGGLTAVESLRIAYGWGVLPETLDFIRRTWPNTPRACQRTTLLGVAAMMKAYDGQPGVNMDNLSERLITMPVTTIESRARSLAEAHGGTAMHAWQEFTQILVQEYNKKRHYGRLESPTFKRGVVANWEQGGAQAS